MVSDDKIIVQPLSTLDSPRASSYRALQQILGKTLSRHWLKRTVVNVQGYDQLSMFLSTLFTTWSLAEMSASQRSILVEGTARAARSKNLLIRSPTTDLSASSYNPGDS